MSRDPSSAPLLASKFEGPTSETVEMTEIDGIKQGAILQFTDVGSSNGVSENKEVRTCYGNLYVIVNALRDYANILDSVIKEWSLIGFHAVTYEMHAARCRKIAGRYAAAIGYDYDKALEQCQKRRAKGERNEDTGVEGLEALMRKREQGGDQKSNARTKKCERLP